MCIATGPLLPPKKLFLSLMDVRVLTLFRNQNVKLVLPSLCILHEDVVPCVSALYLLLVNIRVHIFVKPIISLKMY